MNINTDIFMLILIVIMIYLFFGNFTEQKKENGNYTENGNNTVERAEKTISKITGIQQEGCGEDLVKCPNNNREVPRAAWNNCGPNLMNCMSVEEMMSYSPCSMNLVKCPDSEKLVGRVEWNKCGPDLSRC